MADCEIEFVDTKEKLVNDLDTKHSPEIESESDEDSSSSYMENLMHQMRSEVTLKNNL